MGSVWIAGSYQSDYARNYAREGLEMQTRLHRWRMNLVTGATSEQDLSEACTEFGAINSGFGGRPYRYTYAATSEPGWFLFNGLVKHDALTGREERYQFEPGVFCSEAGVAPRVGGTEEDDAYLVTLTVDMNRDLSECVVFRASDVGRDRSRALSSPSGSRVARTAAGRRATPSEDGLDH
jgi:carotenoid cleavage dioxygenase-like enzyme